MQLTWAENIVRQTHGRVLVLTPLAVSSQTVREGAKFGIACERSSNGRTTASITVTNYERLHYFSPADFVGVVCDESSCLKHFRGATQRAVTDFAKRLPYRLLCTATAAPNDYVELGTSSEVLSELGMIDMLTRFFKQDPQIHQLNALKHGRDPHAGLYVSGTSGGWRLKGHAVTPFWRWVASWARACRRPSDLGFDDAAFRLPPLVEQHHVVVAATPPSGMLFTAPAVGLQAERDERRRTLKERCALVADLVNDGRQAVVWCHLNVEGDTLARMIPGSRQVRGADSDETKESAYLDFVNGDLRVLVTKPKIGAWGLNWEHCAHVVTFASHSFEQFYQSVRRCWRYGQTQPVTVDIISTEGEQRVRESMLRKAAAADVMFSQLVTYMQDATRLAPDRPAHATVEVPAWIT